MNRNRGESIDLHSPSCCKQFQNCYTLRISVHRLHSDWLQSIGSCGYRIRIRWSAVVNGCSCPVSKCICERKHGGVRADYAVEFDANQTIDLSLIGCHVRPHHCSRYGTKLHLAHFGEISVQSLINPDTFRSIIVQFYRYSCIHIVVKKRSFNQQIE